MKMNKKRIHLSKVFELVQVLDEFSITWVAEDGRRIIVPRAVFSGKKKKRDRFYSRGRSFNIICLPSMEIRKVKLETIIEINGLEVFI